MPTAGPNSPGTVQNDTGIGTLAWSNPTNANSSNDNYAICAITSGGAISNYAKSRIHGFSIPSGVTITNITVEIEIKGGVSGGSLHRVYLVKGGTIGSTDLASGNAIGTTDAYISVSGLGGFTWTDADINGTEFGAAVSVTSSGIVTISLDHIRITVTYVVPGSIVPVTQVRKVRNLHYLAR